MVQELDDRLVKDLLLLQRASHVRVRSKCVGIDQGKGLRFYPEDTHVYVVLADGTEQELDSVSVARWEMRAGEDLPRLTIEVCETEVDIEVPIEGLTVTNGTRCRCRRIQADDPRRHFKGCPRREDLPEEQQRAIDEGADRARAERDQRFKGTMLELCPRCETTIGHADCKSINGDLWHADCADSSAAGPRSRCSSSWTSSAWRWTACTTERWSTPTATGSGWACPAAWPATHGTLTMLSAIEGQSAAPAPELA